MSKRHKDTPPKSKASGRVSCPVFSNFCFLISDF